MVRVRFAPSPTGSLQVGNALTAVANRRFADDHAGTLLLRIDDTDPARNVPGGEPAILDDLAWLGVQVDEGPVRQSDRRHRYREAADNLLETEAAFEDRGAIRFADEATLLRLGGTPTYHLASVVDDADFKIAHVICDQDHRPNQPLHDRQLRRLAPEQAQPAHGAHDLDEAQRPVTAIMEPPAAVPAPNGSRGTLEGSRDLRARSDTRLNEAGARRLLADLRRTGATLRALRLAHTGAETGPELWRVLAALPRDEGLRRIDAAL